MLESQIEAPLQHPLPTALAFNKTVGGYTMTYHSITCLIQLAAIVFVLQHHRF